MAAGDQFNIRPQYETTTLPCEGQLGDLLIVTPLHEGEPDNSQQGVASLWVCIRSETGEFRATWARVQFDGIATCEWPIPEGPQNHEELHGG